jgi:Mn-dependent DtxR family transcriptional regulator
MNLTRRQKEFMRNLLDLYREQEAPLHYTVLAKRLGVSRFTAYDMLRLLEEKGLVTSSYQLDEERSGPGRSEVVYAPTERAHRIMDQLTGEVGGADWEEVKGRILDRIQNGHVEERPLAEEMLARVPPDEPEVIRYCVEVMTVVSLRLRRRTGRRVLLAFLPQILDGTEGSCRPSLSLLGGFALGVLADEAGSDQKWEETLLEHVSRYQALVVDMEHEVCQRLAERLTEVFTPLLKQ